MPSTRSLRKYAINLAPRAEGPSDQRYGRETYHGKRDAQYRHQKSEKRCTDGLTYGDGQKTDHEPGCRPVGYGAGTPDEVDPRQHHICRAENGTADKRGDRAEAEADRQYTGRHQEQKDPVNVIIDPFVVSTILTKIAAK